MFDDLGYRLGSGKPSNVIVDGGKDSDEDEDETFMVEETAAPQEQEQVRTFLKSHGNIVSLS